MNATDYNRFLHAIEAANDFKDKEALRRLKAQILANHSSDDNDVARLLNKFKFNV